MIKLLCSDFDNTLARRGRVPRINVEEIPKLRANGIEFAIVTGRVASNIISKAEKYKIDAHIVGTNGSIVLEKGDHLLFEHPIDRSIIGDIVQECHDNGWYYFIFDRDDVYIPEEKFGIVTKTPLAHIASFFAKTKVFGTNHRLEQFDAYGAKAHKINIYPKKQEVMDVREEYLKNEELYVTWSNNNKLEIMAADVNKWNGILHLAEKLGIEKHEIATIGDYNNDIPMIVNSEMGFAVGNAHEEIKEIADHVVRNVEDGAVAEAIDFIINHNSKLKTTDTVDNNEDRQWNEYQ